MVVHGDTCTAGKQLFTAFCPEVSEALTTAANVYDITGNKGNDSCTASQTRLFGQLQLLIQAAECLHQGHGYNCAAAGVFAL